MVKKTITVTILLLLASGFAYGTFSMVKGSDVAKVGDPAPVFTLPSVDGEMVSLSDYKGQFVILNFFTTWCPPCIKEAPELQAFEEKYGDQVKLLILDRGEAKVTVQKFIEKYGTTSTYLLDKNMKWSDPYGVTGQPETFFIDEEGIIRYHRIGPMTTEYMVKMTNKFKDVSLK